MRQPQWIATVCHAEFTSPEDWSYDEYMGDWTAEVYDRRFNGSHELWTVDDNGIHLEQGSYTASYVSHDHVVVMGALCAGLDAFNVFHKASS